MRRLALPRIFRLFWMPPKNPYLNQATPKTTCQIFLPEETKSNCAWKLTSRKNQGLCSLFWSEARLHVSGIPWKRRFFSIFGKYAFTRSITEIFSLAYATKVKTMEMRKLSLQRSCCMIYDNNSSRVPNDLFSQNWLYNVVKASRVFLRQPMLIFNFPGKKYPLFTASQQDFQKIKIPASNHVWRFFASKHG